MKIGVWYHNKAFDYIFFPLCNFSFFSFFTIGFRAKDFEVGTWIFEQFFASSFLMPNTLVCISSVFIVYYYRKHENDIGNTLKKYIIVFAAIWSIFFAFGKSYHILKNWMLVFGSIYNFIFILAICFFSTVSIALFLIVTLSIFKKIELIDFKFFTKKYVFWISLASFFSIECIYIIAFFPGIATWDGRYQLTEFYGIHQWTNHHPIVSTLVEGSIVEFGRRICDYNFGLFLFVFLQSLLQSCIFAYTVKFISDVVKSKAIVILSYIYFLFNPVVAIWGIGLGKDGIYYLSFLWFVIALVKFCKYSNDNMPLSIYVQLIFSAFLCGFFRKEAAIIMTISLITAFLFSCYSRNRKKTLIYATAFYMTFFTAFNLFLNLNHIYSPRKEALCIPLQQTARLVWSNQVLEKEDMKIIDELFGHKDLHKLYKPSHADPVKKAFIESDANYYAWKDIYFKYLKIYPESYIEAIINQNYGYFYPFFKPIDYGYYHMPRKDGFQDDIALSTISKAEGLQNFLKSTPKVFMGMPFFSFYYNCSFFVWSLLFICGFALIRKCWSVICISIPLLLTFAVCLLSPVGADARYMLPIIASYPLWMSVSLKDLGI